MSTSTSIVLQLSSMTGIFFIWHPFVSGNWFCFVYCSIISIHTGHFTMKSGIFYSVCIYYNFLFFHFKSIFEEPFLKKISAIASICQIPWVWSQFHHGRLEKRRRRKYEENLIIKMHNFPVISNWNVTAWPSVHNWFARIGNSYLFWLEKSRIILFFLLTKLIQRHFS
jgi:hypothetical protein